MGGKRVDHVQDRGAPMTRCKTTDMRAWLLEKGPFVTIGTEWALGLIKN